jgi:predicted Fe-Mo cluster-binding NifX family protein
MKIAIPVVEGLLSLHFGHCESFAILDVDMENKQILSTDVVAAPAHEPGLLPRWLGERDVNMIISGGMGQRAKDLFTEQSIDVIVGATAQPPEAIVKSYMQGALSSGANACDSDGSGCDH